MEKNTIIVIGAGLAGLSTAALLAKNGFHVIVVDKLDMPGGVARCHEENGFMFDTGPSWYLMKEVYDRFFGFFGKKTSDYYSLIPLDPSYKIFFEDGTIGTISKNQSRNEKLFDSLEKDGGKNLKRFLVDSARKYRLAVDRFLYREYRSILPFLNPLLLLAGLRLNIFSKLDNFVKRFFRDRRARQIVEFNTVFLGSNPFQTPALYSLMAHADMSEGVFYPENGSYDLVRALHQLCEEQGVVFRFNTEVREIIIADKKASGVRTGGEIIEADAGVAACDYHHTDTVLVAERYRNYSPRYWESRIIAPATFLVLLGIDWPIPNLSHHNFFFATDWRKHFASIFDEPAWPENPSYYIGAASKTSAHAAPVGCETLFILVPVAPGLPDSAETRGAFSGKIIAHLSGLTGVPLEKHIIVKKIIAHDDFKTGLNYFKGSGLGLSHTLFQTAFCRPSHGSRRVKDLYYTGHYTQPGIGMPMALIGSELLCKRICKKSAVSKNGDGKQDDGG